MENFKKRPTVFSHARQHALSDVGQSFGHDNFAARARWWRTAMLDEGDAVRVREFIDAAEGIIPEPLRPLMRELSRFQWKVGEASKKEDAKKKRVAKGRKPFLIHIVGLDPDGKEFILPEDFCRTLAETVTYYRNEFRAQAAAIKPGPLFDWNYAAHHIRQVGKITNPELIEHTASVYEGKIKRPANRPPAEIKIAHRKRSMASLSRLTADAPTETPPLFKADNATL
jgi:hypothetical protein